MERILVVIFDDESKAKEGAKEFGRLDEDGDISVYAEALIRKNNNGSTTIVEKSDAFPLNTISGTAIGAMLGLLGSDMPIAGAATGALAGSLMDLDRAGVTADFLADVAKKLKPGKYAVVSDISEEYTAPVDEAMKTLGGTVFRTTPQNLEDERYARETKAIKADIKELKKEEKTEEREERKAELHEKINSLEQRLHNKLEEAKMHIKDRDREAKTKTEYLEGKLKSASGKAKAALRQRIQDLHKQSGSQSSTTS